MDTYFKKIVADDGTETFEEVTITSDDVPEEIITSTPAYKKLVQESKARRRRAQAAERELEALRGKSSETGEEEPEEKQAIAFDEDALFTKFAQLLATQAEQEREEKKAKNAVIDGLLTQHKLNADLRPVLEGSVDPESVAQLLGSGKYQFVDTTGGATDGTDDVSDLMSRVTKGLGLNND